LSLVYEFSETRPVVSYMHACANKVCSFETKMASTFEVIDYSTVQDIFVIFVASGGTAACYKKGAELD